MEHEGANLEILDKPLEECYEMFRFSNIPRNSFLEEVFRENYNITQLTAVVDGVLS
jgi:hypothetical protein